METSLKKQNNLFIKGLFLFQNSQQLSVLKRTISTHFDIQNKLLQNPFWFSNKKLNWRQKQQKNLRLMLLIFQCCFQNQLQQLYLSSLITQKLKQKLQFNHYNIISSLGVAPNKFLKLQVLDLSNNFIESISQLERLDLKFLKELDLHGNQISEIKSLRKSNLSKIKIVNLKNNMIRCHEKLSQFQCAQLENYQFDGFTDQKVRDNIDFLIKMQNKSISNKFNPGIHKRQPLWKTVIKALQKKCNTDFKKYDFYLRKRFEYEV